MSPLFDFSSFGKWRDSNRKYYSGQRIKRPIEWNILEFCKMILEGYINPTHVFTLFSTHMTFAEFETCYAAPKSSSLGAVWLQKCTYLFVSRGGNLPWHMPWKTWRMGQKHWGWFLFRECYCYWKKARATSSSSASRTGIPSERGQISQERTQWVEEENFKK